MVGDVCGHSHYDKSRIKFVMRHNIYNELCNFRKRYGAYKNVFWHNELEHSCHEHIKYMVYHSVCQHAPTILLNGAFECIASHTCDNLISDDEALGILLYDYIGHSKEHTQLIRNANHIAGAIGHIERCCKQEYYLCIRGY